MKKIKKPQILKKEWLDTLTYDEIQENIRRSILSSTPHEEFTSDSDALRFCDEIENYLELRFIEKRDKIDQQVCDLLHIPTEGLKQWLIDNRKEVERNYKWII